MTIKKFLLAFACLAALASAHAQAAGASARDDERARRSADIALFTSGFDGGDARLACARPLIPPTSKTNVDIAKVDREVQQWFECCNAFVQRLNDALPPAS